MTTERIDGLDIFRGWAILFMVLYHFTYDLNHFHIISVNMNQATEFLISRYIIMTLFILGVGISLALVHKPYIRWRSVKKRLLLLGLASTLVSIATYIEFPNAWVYFGILHFILLSSILVLPFLSYPRVTLALSIVILIGSFYDILNMHTTFNFLQPILHLPPLNTEDLVPLTPWFAVVLIGTLFVHYNLYKKFFNLPIFSVNFLPNSVLKFMGQNSLVIYLIHQPILFLSFMLFLK